VLANFFGKKRMSTIGFLACPTCTPNQRNSLVDGICACLPHVMKLCACQNHNRSVVEVRDLSLLSQFFLVDSLGIPFSGNNSEPQKNFTTS